MNLPLDLDPISNQRASSQRPGATYLAQSHIHALLAHPLEQRRILVI